MFHRQQQCLLGPPQVEVGVAPGMEVRGATQCLSSGSSVAVLACMVDHHHCELVLAGGAQVGQHATHLASVVFVNPVQADKRVQQQHARLQRHHGVRKALLGRDRGRGETVSHAPLPHHRAYGVRTRRFKELRSLNGKAWQSECGDEVGIGQGFVGHGLRGHPPQALGVHGYSCGQPAFGAPPYQLPVDGGAVLPLFETQGAKAAEHPLFEVMKVLAHLGQVEIVLPTGNQSAQGLQYFFDALATPGKNVNFAKVLLDLRRKPFGRWSVAITIPLIPVTAA